MNGAAGGAIAGVNVASVTGSVRGSNSQTAVVKGAVINGAALGGHAEVNIASRRSSVGGNRQAVVVGGSVVNGAALGMSSVVNIN